MFRSMAFALLLFAGFAHDAAAQDGSRVVAVKRASFDDIRDSVEAAIIGRGLVVNNVARIGEMLERTGADIGDSRRVYLKAESLEFCSAALSRKMMEADPDNIAFCPYVIAIYTLPEKPDEVRVAYRRPIAQSPASKKALEQVDSLLFGIVEEALR